MSKRPTLHLAFERDIVEIQAQISKLLDLAERRDLDVTEEIEGLSGRLDLLKQQTYENLEPMQQVQVARHPSRPYTLDYVERMFTDLSLIHI